MAAPSSTPVALVTGAAKRIGRGIAEGLHAHGYAVCLHYNKSKEEAAALAAALNTKRADSAIIVQGDLSTAAPVASDSAPVPLFKRCANVLEAPYTHWGRCDVLVNNASAYYPTPLVEPKKGQSEVEAAKVEAAASDLFGSNAVAPYYLTKAFAQRVADTPAEQRGHNYCIVNMVDSMTNQPLHEFTVYTMAKAALEGLTRAAALELAPLSIRVNGVGPGLGVIAVEAPKEWGDDMRSKIPLCKREASVEEISHAVEFLCSNKAKYITGAFLNVDAGWSLTRN